MVIAIDGPAGAGKTSSARAVAQSLGYFYMDSGAMYRAITYAVLNAYPTYSEREVNELLKTLRVDIRYVDNIMRVIVNDKDVTRHLRSAEINNHVSNVASYKEVRAKLVDIQRNVAVRMSENGFGVVVDGRDIGTVVFPDADLKFFLDASPEVRARRRFDELSELGKERPYEDILASINERDEIDSSREISPLKKAEDAILIDTSGLSFEDQVLQVINVVKERQPEHDV